MDAPSTHQITQLLVEWNNGDRVALEKLIPLVHAELHRIAHRHMAGERPGHILQTTALVNEAYMRLIDWKNVEWQNRAHFFAVSARLMRQILVDYARKRGGLKRGGKASPVSLDEAIAARIPLDDDLIAVHEALLRLSEIDARKGQIVELRFFSGLTEEETAEVLNISPETVRRDWRFAKAWLRNELK